MSGKVMTWVWERSPTKGTELLMLLAIADNASDDGTDAFPSVRTLARKTRLDERTVQRVIRRLTDEGHLRVEKEGGRKSNRYAVLMDRESSTPPANRHPRQNATGGTATPPQPRHDPATPGAAQLRHPNLPGTVLDPSSGAREDERSQSDGFDKEEGEPSADIDAVLDRLGSAWPLTPTQRRRLAPKVVEALAAGWSAQRLAEHLSANPEGVKSPAAVLTSRLDDLPSAADGARDQRPSWCGQCDEPSRTIERSDGRWRRCPDCHPQHADRNSGRPKPPSTHRPESSTPTDHQTGRSTTSVSHRA
ncbi:hypothetical protein FHX42_002666 [Saccharopolyspora lacisalsi]|uniref:Helix-turn-helix domain-containing protein n=1 Tax=Halosaccharopolyspora lacisalsi TaxID=1000566 RepID=A0A839E0W4_9PSEU|nr:helix-turn-helix domain-containing protein [Halosaccharopolyspora lacisalsi]MBA8825315.1 hypothetical protein [Halosaccharopolyspora lacisalsi]